MRVSILNSKSDESFAKVVAESNSIRAVMLALGYRANSGAIFYEIRKRINSLKLDTSHFGETTNKIISNNNQQYKLEDILVEKSTYKSIYRLKLRLVAEGRLNKICDICGLGDIWNGKPITLQLDHINGIPNDHRIENLRFLCPNCHSQTHNFSGRNKLRNL